MATQTLNTGRARAPKLHRDHGSPRPATSPYSRPPLPASSITAMGQHIHELCSEFDQLDAQGGKTRYATRRADAERHTLAGLVLLRPAETLADAAVQAACAYYKAEALADDDRLPAILREMVERMRCAFASIAVAVCRETGADLDRLAFGDMRAAHAREFSGGPAVAPQAEAADPDAALIEACDEATNLDREWCRRINMRGRTNEEDDRVEAEAEPLKTRCYELVEKVQDRVPTTREGERALARLVLQLSDGVPDSDATDAITRTVLRAIAGQTEPEPEPDAVLLAVCADFHARHEAVQAMASEISDEVFRPANEARWDVAHRVADMLAVTEAGKQEKMRVALVLMEEMNSGPCAADDATEIALAAMRNMVGAA